MKNKRILLPYLYALITIVCTFLVGQLILWFVPDNTNIWASVLFIFMNLLPMLVAFGFVQMSGEMSGIGQILKAAFSPHERRYAYGHRSGGAAYLLRNISFTGKCDFYRFPIFGHDCLFPLDAFAGRTGRGGVAMVSANPYIHKEKFCAENARYIRHLVYMAFPHLSSAVDHGWFLQLPHLFPDDTWEHIYPGCSKRIVARLHSLHSRPYAYRHSGGHHACWEQFNKSSFACRRGNYPLCDSGRHIGPQAKAAKPGLNPLSAK